MSQIFKTSVPIYLLIDFIHEYLYYDKMGQFYILNKYVYKKLKLLNTLDIFLESIMPYYYLSKQKYLEKARLKYSNFATVIRQLCKHLNIHIKSSINYHNSTYEIEYYITCSKQFTSSCNGSACSSVCSSVCSSIHPSPR